MQILLNRVSPSKDLNELDKRKMGIVKKNKSTLEEKGNNLIQKAATLKGNESQAAAPALISVAALHEHQSLQSQWKTGIKKKHRSAFVPIRDNNYTVMDRGPS